MASNFSSVPILDYSLVSDPKRRPEFIRDLQNALVNVGFLYLSNPPVAREDIDAVIDYAPKVFDIPQESKEKIRMINSPHFFGYSRFGAELTKGKVDQREQYDFGTQYGENGWKPGDPEYLKLWGPPQWPDEELVPGFRDTYSRYIAQYPVPEDDSSDQGVGPHYDGGFLTFLLQASPHRGLQVQNLAGDWIDAPPIPYTFVVNIGKALEKVTQGLTVATSHQVLSPAKGSTPRYSIPFFQMLTQDVVIGDNVLEISPEILKLKESRPSVHSDSVNYAEYGKYPAGQVALIGRVKSHPDVAERHYPDLFKQFFPEGLPAHGFAY
ncbi:Clavaminate synthase-like protein [Abortiporus biennis]|nr:Clavaminate synthase-like protein [Abortiporus biennis]